MRKPAWPFAVSAVACLALAGCGVSVAAGGENAATHPASGVWVASTVGSENISVRQAQPAAPYHPPASTAPSPLPAGLAAAEGSVKAAITGGCWEDTHEGNVYGAYDQLFWWEGGCGDFLAQVAVELYPTVAAAAKAANHGSTQALLARYRSGAVLVDVYANAPQGVLAQLRTVGGLAAVPGYASP